MNLLNEVRQAVSRRYFLTAGSHLLGTAAMASLAPRGLACSVKPPGPGRGLHLPAKAKHVIYLHMVGGPSQMDLYDYKPVMRQWYDKDLPESVRMGQRLTTMTS